MNRLVIALGAAGFMAMTALPAAAAPIAAKSLTAPASVVTEVGMKKKKVVAKKKVKKAVAKRRYKKRVVAKVAPARRHHWHCPILHR